MFGVHTILTTLINPFAYRNFIASWPGHEGAVATMSSESSHLRVRSLRKRGRKCWGRSGAGWGMKIPFGRCRRRRESSERGSLPPCVQYGKLGCGRNSTGRLRRRAAPGEEDRIKTR
ncbi:hypothetical protein SEVIR_7G117950v4 [Setaria viridis]